MECRPDQKMFLSLRALSILTITMPLAYQNSVASTTPCDACHWFLTEVKTLVSGNAPGGMTVENALEVPKSLEIFDKVIGKVFAVVEQ
uniref:Saposin B-type domain-containing protein n=1 Tax=Angiostrongylus cantonensis TaxID=6313 RepID=A0A0K0D0X2_ANGCA